MASPRNKKSVVLWFFCDKCGANISQKDLDKHTNDCPPSLTIITYNFVTKGTLYGSTDLKANEEIKGISAHDKNNLVFLSQSAIQLCNLAIGEYALLQDVENKFSACARIVWPSLEKSVASVLFTKNGLDLSFGKDTYVKVSKLNNPAAEARQIIVVSLTNLKNLEVSSELLMRLRKLHGRRVLAENNKIMIMYFGKVLHFKIKSIKAVLSEPSFEEGFNKLNLEQQFYKATQDTQWIVCKDEAEYNKQIINIDLLTQIGGLKSEIFELKDLMRIALGYSKSLSDLMISRGVLLYGASGTGKTLIATALAQNCEAHIIEINMVNLYKNKSTESEIVISDLLSDLPKSSPCFIHIDEIDILCPSRTTRLTEADKRLMANLINLFDSVHQIPGNRIFILATSNKPDSIDSSFRRCGRIDREIEIPTPNPNARLEILDKLLTAIPHNLTKDELEQIARTAHGFVGSDLVALCSRASLNASKENHAEIAFSDFKFALTRIRPSAMREVQVEVPNIKWSDIGGQDNLKLILKQAVEWPLKHPESFVRLGITPPRGVLMYGPPGCSKTMIAKALATESGLNFLSIKGPELFSKWVGESERAIREVFRKARQVAPSIIFFDEIDALGSERSSGSSTSVQERVLAQLLTELDGVTPLGDVTVLAATNRPDRIDRALLRPGRLDRIVYVPLPNSDTRKEIFKLKLSKMPVMDVQIDDLVSLTKGYSGAEVNAVCHEAAMKALEENLEATTVNNSHFDKALLMITPRTSSSLLKIYEDYTIVN